MLWIWNWDIGVCKLKPCLIQISNKWALLLPNKDHQKILDDVKQTLESCRKTQEHLTKTQEKLKVVKDENGNIVGAVSDLEAKWKAFQDAFDQMNKQMIANIAASMGKEVKE